MCIKDRGITAENFHEVQIAFIKRARRDKKCTTEFVIVSPHSFRKYKTAKAITKLAKEAEK